MNTSDLTGVVPSFFVDWMNTYTLKVFKNNSFLFKHEQRKTTLHKHGFEFYQTIFFHDTVAWDRLSMDSYYLEIE